jgi:ABC-type dipeptide/oligopeptide/nickel transport system permease component
VSPFRPRVFCVMVFSIAVDMAYAFIDPRIRLT